MRGLTEQQKLFCKYYTDEKSDTFGHIQNSGIKAGYAESSAHVTASKLLKNPKIIQYISFLKKTVEEIFTEGAKDALATLQEIHQDKKAPSASRVASAKDLLDRAGYGATKKIDAKVNVAGSVVTSTETTIIQNIVNQNEDVAETLMQALRARQRPVTAQEEKE